MTKKTPAKVAPAKKSAAKKTPAKATAVTKTAATKVTKAVAKTTVAKTTVAKKSAVKAAPAKAAPATKVVAKKASAKAVPATKTAVTKTAATKAVAKKASVKAKPVKKIAVKPPVVKAAPVKKAVAPKAAETPAAKAASVTKAVAPKAAETPVAKAAPAEKPVAPPVLEKALLASLEPAKVPVAKLERDAHIVERRADAPVLRAQPASTSPAPRTRTIVAPASSAAPASSLPSPLKRARPVHRPDPQGADALFLAHAAAAGLEGASVEIAWARMPLFAPLLALALVRQGADAVVQATIRAAASEVPDADVVDALAALSAPSRRAVQTLAEARDEATLARKPARASLLDAIQHALEGALAREEGDATTAYERGIEVGRALTAAVALGRRLDASEPDQRAEVVRSLHERLLALSPALPAVG